MTRENFFVLQEDNDAARTVFQNTPDEFGYFTVYADGDCFVGPSKHEAIAVMFQQLQKPPIQFIVCKGPKDEVVGGYIQPK